MPAFRCLSAGSPPADRVLFRFVLSSCPCFPPPQASESFEVECDHVLAATGKQLLPYRC
jgi:hypothetical protein